jgi:signal transduction histidine kinase
LSFDTSLVLAYGITFGILIMTIVYTFVRYLYSKELIYISYSGMQFFSLLYIASYGGFFTLPNHMQELFLALATVGAVLFAITFYEGKFFPEIKNTKELIVNTLLLYVVILSVFYHYILFEYLPYTLIYGILFLSTISNIKQGLNPTSVYVIGWSLLSFLLFVFDLKDFYLEMGYIDIVLVAFAIEAMLFTTSVSYRYNLLRNQSIDNEKMLLQQSKLAKSGEMIGNITHQFRQPLNNLSYLLINIKKKLQKSEGDSEYYKKKFNQAQEQLQFLSKTIDDFKEFYTPSKRTEDFCVKDSIENAVTILSAELKNRGIELEFDFNIYDGIKVHGIKNELSQVVLALISNSSDALVGKENPLIKLKVDASSSEVIVSVEDNASGIKSKDIEKIFEPYFSTKDDGTGIGLYLVKVIIENSFDGKIEVQNQEEGVKFTLYLGKVI